MTKAFPAMSRPASPVTCRPIAAAVRVERAAPETGRSERGQRPANGTRMRKRVT